MQSWICEFCPIKRSGIKLLLSHITKHHGCSTKFKCPVDMCSRVFVKYDTLYRHVKKNHRDFYDVETAEDDLENSDNSHNDVAGHNLSLGSSVGNSLIDDNENDDVSPPAQPHEEFQQQQEVS